MANEYKLSFTGNEIDEKLRKVDINEENISKLSDEKANKTYVDGEIAKAQLEGAGVDTSQFVTKDDLKNVSDDIPEAVRKAIYTLFLDTAFVSGIDHTTEIETLEAWANNKVATLLSLDKTVLHLVVNSGQTTITATVEPKELASDIIWTSSNKEIANVSNGVVTPVSVGNCTITATVGTLMASCSVTVVETPQNQIEEFYGFERELTLVDLVELPTQDSENLIIS